MRSRSDYFCIGKNKHLFEADTHPGKPRVLFIGLAESTHTQSWIDLLDQSELNVRLFALPSGLAPDNWPVRIYVTKGTAVKLDAVIRTRLYPRSLAGRFLFRAFAHLFFGDASGLEGRWLAKIIRQWRPDVIHTLGLEPASYFYLKVREKYGLQRIGKWVVQVRGGPDLALHRLMSEYYDKIRKVLRNCDQLIADNQKNYEYGLELGLERKRLCPLGVIPGTGGIDVAHTKRSWRGLPSQRRRLVLWPKAYECPQGKALSVFEAIKIAWNSIQPCEFHMLAMIPETRMWFQTLPVEIRRCCRIDDRIPRDKTLELMAQARVMLSPSLADGIPNTLYEAMATGTFPIVSPLETIQSVVVSEENVLFARNLYPEEIAEALCRAMTDDALVDRAAERNLEIVSTIADRAQIRPRVVEYYKTLARDKLNGTNNI